MVPIHYNGDPKRPKGILKAYESMLIVMPTVNYLQVVGCEYVAVKGAE